MKNPLSAKRLRLLALIARHEDEERFSLVKDWAHELGLRHESSLKAMLDALVEQGYLSLQGGGAERHQRLYRPTPRARAALGLPAARGTESFFRLPVLGTVTAGPLREAVQEGGDLLDVPPLLRGRPGDFFLHVSGDSMVDAGILPGDYALIRPGIGLARGEIGAVQMELPDGRFESTLKRVFAEPEAARLVLRAANAAYNDIVVEDEELLRVTVVGAYRGLMRAFP